MSEKFNVIWLDAGREPQCPPDPKYPNGVDVFTAERPACKVELPYPAPRCGAHVIICNECNRRTAVTAAGRPDDPRSVMMPCKMDG